MPTLVKIKTSSRNWRIPSILHIDYHISIYFWGLLKPSFNSESVTGSEVRAGCKLSKRDVENVSSKAFLDQHYAYGQD